MAAVIAHDGDRLVIYPSRTRMVLILAGAVAFVVAGVWLAGPWMVDRVTTRARIISMAGVVFFGMCGIYAAYRLVRRYPLLVADPSGIIDSASVAAAGHIAWDEIERMAAYQFSGQWMLGIWPRDQEELLNRQGRLAKRLMKVNVSLGAAPVNIPQVALPIPVAELADLLHSRFGGGVR